MSKIYNENKRIVTNIWFCLYDYSIVIEPMTLFKHIIKINK